MNLEEIYAKANAAYNTIGNTRYIFKYDNKWYLIVLQKNKWSDPILVNEL